MKTDAGVLHSAEIDQLVAAARAAADGYVGRVIESPRLSVGIYRLAAGALDPQAPHREDEVYYTIAGRARLRVGDDDRPVKPGSLLFVPAGAEHRFHEIEEELLLLVFWAPPEDSVS